MFRRNTIEERETRVLSCMHVCLWAYGFRGFETKVMLCVHFHACTILKYIEGLHRNYPSCHVKCTKKSRLSLQYVEIKSDVPFSSQL